MRGLRSALVLAAGATLVVVGAAGATSFADPAGDQIDAVSFAGPDITTVDVTNTADGGITFQVAIPNYPTLQPNSAVAVVLDLDRNLDTGEDGIEAEVFYSVDSFQTVLSFNRWDGLELVGADTSRLTASYTAGVFTLTIPRSELRDTTGFAFLAAAIRLTAEPAELGFDVAPNGEELWAYDLVGLAPPRPPTLTIGAINGIPALPQSGKRFVATAFVTRSDTRQLVDRAVVTCSVRVGTKRVRANGRHRAFNAQCVFTVPPGAKGKAVRGTMTVRAAGATRTKAFRFRIV
jgi:hypothetical protein